MMLYLKNVLWQLLGVTLFAGAIATAAGTDQIASEYRCDRYWSGPAILLPGGLLPLPHGYALVDRTSRPHIFRNFVAAVLDGGELGNIHVGFTPSQQEWVADESEFRVRSSTWKGIQREQLRHLPTGQVLEVFSFADGVMMEFSGAALPFAEMVASCYLELSNATADATRSSGSR
jgi:hypothetical protein